MPKVLPAGEQGAKVGFLMLDSGFLMFAFRILCPVFSISPASRRIFILYQHIRKSVNIPNKSGYCFKKTTIHFAHYVRSVAATRRFCVLSRAINRWLSLVILKLGVILAFSGLFHARFESEG